MGRLLSRQIRERFSATSLSKDLVKSLVRFRPFNPFLSVFTLLAPARAAVTKAWRPLKKSTLAPLHLEDAEQIVERRKEHARANAESPESEGERALGRGGCAYRERRRQNVRVLRHRPSPQDEGDLRGSRHAREAAAAQVTFILWGWAVAQYPYVLPPSLTISATASPERTLTLTLWGLGVGACVLFPSLYYLFRIFK